MAVRENVVLRSVYKTMTITPGPHKQDRGSLMQGRDREIVLKRETIPASQLVETEKWILTISRPKLTDGAFTGAG